jgi:Kef-type K+ transport system membrane component KefB
MEETTGILVDLFILFAAAKATGELFTRIRQPAIVGEVLVGVIIGPHAIGLVGTPDNALIELFHGDKEAAEETMTVVLDVLAEVGVIVLLFFVGLETRLRDLLEVGTRSFLVAVLGIIFPFAFGFALIFIVDPIGSEDLGIEAAFVATAMVAEARIILGAAVADDILALLLLSVVKGLGGDDFNALEISLTAVAAVAFVVFAALVGTRIVRQYSIHLEKLHIENAPFLFAMALMLGLAALAGVIGLAAIVGAFLAGMMLAEAKERFNLEEQALPVYEFLVPFFFVIIGTKVDLDAFTDPTVLAIALAVIGAGIGAISDDVFSVVVFMSIATTLIAPPFLVLLFRGYRFTAEDVAEVPDDPGLSQL